MTDNEGYFAPSAWKGGGTKKPMKFGAQTPRKGGGKKKGK